MKYSQKTIQISVTDALLLLDEFDKKPNRTLVYSGVMDRIEQALESIASPTTVTPAKAGAQLEKAQA